MSWEEEELLLTAAQNNNLSSLRKLIDKGVDIDCADSSGNTPLHLACFSGSIEAVKELLVKGADVYSSDQEGREPIHDCCSSSSIKCLNMLIEYGANIDSCDDEGRSVLHYAVKKFSNKKFVYNVLSLGADKNIKDIYGRTCLDIAINTGNNDFVGYYNRWESDVLNKDVSCFSMQNKQKFRM